MTEIKTIVDFISDQNNNLIFVGNFQKKAINQIIKQFKNPITTKISGSDFLRLNFNYFDNTAILILDPDTSNLLIRFINHDQSMDNIDIMILNRLNEKLQSNKVIFNTSKINKSNLSHFIKNLDYIDDPDFNYLLIDNFIAVHTEFMQI